MGALIVPAPQAQTFFADQRPDHTSSHNIFNGRSCRLETHQTSDNFKCTTWFNLFHHQWHPSLHIPREVPNKSHLSSTLRKISDIIGFLSFWICSMLILPAIIIAATKLHPIDEDHDLCFWVCVSISLFAAQAGAHYGIRDDVIGNRHLGSVEHCLEAIHSSFDKWTRGHEPAPWKLSQYSRAAFRTRYKASFVA